MTTPGDTIIQGATTGLIAGIALGTLSRAHRLSQEAAERSGKKRPRRPRGDVSVQADNPQFSNKKFLDAWFRISKKSYNMLWDMFDGAGPPMIERLRFDNPKMFRKVLNALGA